MGVYQKKNGKWYCEFRHGSIRKHLLCRGATNKKEAEQMAAKQALALMGYQKKKKRVWWVRD